MRRGRSSTGNGLLGIRERVAVVGGHFRAGRIANGGFEIAATLSVGSSSGSGSDPSGPVLTRAYIEETRAGGHRLGAGTGDAM